MLEKLKLDFTDYRAYCKAQDAALTAVDESASSSVLWIAAGVNALSLAGDYLIGAALGVVFVIVLTLF